MKKIAIIVSYEPNVVVLETLCCSILGQGYQIVIVDNSVDNPFHFSRNIDGCFVITNGKNMGIAQAQNIGINYAKSVDAEIVTFLDQDSVVSESLLINLEAALLKTQNGVVCPVSIDKLTSLEYPSHKMSRIGMMEDVYSFNSKVLVEVDIAISSGMTTYIKLFDKVGLYDEDFFIDFVDIEWCLRSRKHNTMIYIVPDAIMYHSIGENTIKVGPINIIKHSPLRTYYKVRNSFLFMRKSKNILFSLRQILPALIHNFILVLVVDEKKKYSKYYFKGIYHGVIGVKGEYK